MNVTQSDFGIFVTVLGLVDREMELHGASLLGQRNSKLAMAMAMASYVAGSPVPLPLPPGPPVWLD